MVLVLLALHLVTIHILAPGQQSASEDQVKAAYLLNFAKLADWPRSALPDGAYPLVIGVSGGDEQFLNVLRSTFAGKTAGTHLLVVKPVGAEADMKACQIVFFRSSDSKRNRAIIAGLAPAGVLSVGEDESFLRDGGMINLMRDHGSVRFEVNSDALDHSPIHFSPKILALAKAGSAASHAAKADANDDTTRRVERSVAPEYPELAERMKLKGSVQLQAVVRPDGTVKEVFILGGHPVLADALAHAVMQWKYQPAPKETTETVKFTFDRQ